MRVGFNSLTKGLYERSYEECVEQFLTSKNISKEEFNLFSELLPELSMPIISWKNGEIEDRNLSLSEEQFNRDIIFGIKLGNGMFGNVYKGTFKDQIVAIKTISNQYSISKEDLIDFCKEIGILSALDSPYIVKLYYFFPKPMAMITEFIPGGNLQEEIEKNFLLFNWKIITKILLDISRGISYMHSLNPPILHSDLKSSNILVVNINAEEPNISVKLGDVGCARLANHRGESGEDSIDQSELNGFFEILKELFRVGDLIFPPVPPLLNEIFFDISKRKISSPIFLNLVKRFELIVHFNFDDQILSQNNLFKNTFQIVENFDQFINENNKNAILNLLSKNEELKKEFKFNNSLQKSFHFILYKTLIENDFNYFKSLINNMQNEFKMNDQFIIPKYKSINKIIHLSIKYGKYEITKLILEKGADPNSPNQKGFSPLHLCSIYNQPHLIGLLINHGASPNSLSPLSLSSLFLL